MANVSVARAQAGVITENTDVFCNCHKLPHRLVDKNGTAQIRLKIIQETDAPIKRACLNFDYEVSPRSITLAKRFAKATGSATFSPSTMRA